MSPSLQLTARSHWTMRDSVAAAALFVATCTVVLWQNAHLTVLWDLSYLLDSSFRIALGQVPYRDFPFAHAPLTFVIQAILIRLGGRVFFHHVLYAALVGGLATVLTWRIALHSLRRTVPSAWAVSLLLAAPLTVLGIYSIYPHPIYDCDCVFSILIATFCLQRLTPASAAYSAPAPIRHFLLASAAGASLVVPLFFKQNMGLPFLLAAIGGITFLIAVRLRIHRFFAASPSVRTLLIVLASACSTLVAALVLLQSNVGLHNYIYWTVTFAAERRLPSLHAMLGVYWEPSLLWTIPTIALALLLLHNRLYSFRGSRSAALILLAAPFLWTLLSLFIWDDMEDRAASLLALWPLLLILSALFALYRICTAPSLNSLLPILLLAAINGTLMSQQLWGSTYALWPLLILLIAEVIASLAYQRNGESSAFAALLPALAGIVSIALLLCGGLYSTSNERLSYIHFDEGELAHATLPALNGMTTRGAYLPEFEALIHFADAEIPINDGLILINGEGPFYFATGRTPQFPVLLFDNATDPYTPANIAALARAKKIRWLIVKQNLQLKEDPTPEREATLALLQQEFTLYRTLKGYDVYRHAGVD